MSVVAFLAGLTAGLVVAFLLYLRWPALSREWVGEPQSPVASGGTPALRSAREPNGATAAAAPAPSYDFYNILPEMEVTVPDPGPGPTAAVPDAIAPGAYVLQLASFQRFEDADRAKASLALEGVTASIEQVQIDGRNTWYRVRVGPIADPRELQATRARLRSSYPNSMLLRIKDSGPG